MASGPRNRILIASANPWSFCMAVERDFARIHAGDRVDAINLFSLCSRHSPHWRARDKVIEALNRKIDRFVMPEVSGSDITGDIRIDREHFPPIPRTYGELRHYELGGAKIGLGVLSSVSSLTTIQFPNSLDEYGAMLEAAWHSAHLSLRIGEAVRALGYDRIYIFNGRHCYSRPFCDVLERHAEVVRYEQGSAGNRYISAAGTVYCADVWAEIIRAHPLDEAAADAFYEERFAKNPQSEVTFYTARQKEGVLPTGVERGSYVAFFPSSTDELFAANDEPPYGSLSNQHDIAVALSDACHAQDLQLVVRLHPHLRFKHPTWRREWDFDELRRRGAIVIDPEDACDSYALVRNSRCVITTGSSIGLEATYLGIPNAVVGTWVAGRLGASAELDTPQEIAAFIADPKLPPNAHRGAMLYGSFYKTGGKLLPELDVGIHPNLARIDGRIVDPVRYALQKLRFLFRPPGDPQALDVRSGMQAGRVLLPPGTDYSSAYGKAARSGETKERRASTEKSLAGE
jgi:hypothetical protein